jgi:hypothetical protein
MVAPHHMKTTIPSQLNSKGDPRLFKKFSRNKPFSRLKHSALARNSREFYNFSIVFRHFQLKSKDIIFAEFYPLSDSIMGKFLERNFSLYFCRNIFYAEKCPFIGISTIKLCKSKSRQCKLIAYSMFYNI